MAEQDVKFITLTNNGYIDYTLNCLESLKMIGYEHPLECYVLGEACHTRLQSLGYSSTLLKSTTSGDTKFYRYRTGDWHNITKRKFEIIYDNLEKHPYVCFTDGDIVYLNKNFMKYCLSQIGTNDLLIQNGNMADGDSTNLCSGFMFIRSSERTKELFHPRNIEQYAKPGWGDQLYINIIKRQLKYKKLPLRFFPNGHYYYNAVGGGRPVIQMNGIRRTLPLQPAMVHFNWVVGHDKKQMMKKYKKWFI